MSCSLLGVIIVLGVSLSMFPHMSNGDFFHQYSLLQPENLDQSDIEELERRYENCVAKFKSLDQNISDDLIAGNLNISIKPDFLQIWNTFWNVKLWPNGKIPIELVVSGQTFEERLACAFLYFRTKTCIRFVKKEEDDKNFLLISNNGSLCSSDEEAVMEKDEQIVNFGGKNDINCWKHERIVHQLIQAILFEYNETMGNNTLTDDMDSFKLNQLYQCNSSKTTTKAIKTQRPKSVKCSSVNCCDTREHCETWSKTGLCELTPGFMNLNCQMSCRKCDAQTRSTQTPKTTTQQPIDRSIKVLLIGGWHSESESSMEYYYPYQSQYNSLINVTMIKRRWSHTSVVINDGKIMTMGGGDGGLFGDILKDVEIFNPITNTSTKGQNMNKAREDCDSAIINGIVYVCGGHDEGYNRLSSCEIYQSGVWEYITPMHKVRSRLRLISLNGYLYAIGGLDESRNRLNSVEKYNPQSNSWMMVKSMHTPRSGHGAAVLNGFIYVCNGYGYTHSCERYDPALNTWSDITKTIIDRRNGLRMVSDGHHLFAFGGDYTDALRSVEMYDPKKDKWILLKKSLIHKRFYSSAVVLH